MNTSRFGLIVVLLVGVMTSLNGGAAEKAREIPVTMLVPGFRVRELPVDLTNVNSLEYTADGRLWALGYDGRIFVLTDGDGDGVEETVKVWWQPRDAKAFRGPVGMKVTEAGVYVASKGKISLIKDTKGAGLADTEEVIATGWKEAFTAVDATGMALDKAGNVYFGLGCADFSNAYLLDKEKKAHYDISSSQGTIQKLSADHKTRETLATGVRFAIGLAFNRHGDLFWTDQEGDTWTKGNHLDELNVLFPGKRHYGFPERHAEHLPQTDDEPPVVGFGPQHQSTCGLKFNEAREGWKTFGPKLWENNALVVGESRGKIWRVPLEKVREGYVGRAVPVAAIGMLTIDIAVSPKVDGVICCHSGPPDWGTGPTGKGRLFKISYVDEKAPQPVIAWPAGKDEIRVAFDRAVDGSVVERVTGLGVSAGQYVRAADRLEVMRPPYAVVKAQMQTARRELKIESATLGDEGKTLILKLAEPMPWRGWYAVSIPGVKAVGAMGLGATVDVDFPMAGVELAMGPVVKGNCWLPCLDVEAAFDLTAGSTLQEEHKAGLALAGSVGSVSCKLALPGKVADLVFQASRPIHVHARPGGDDVEVVRPNAEGEYVARTKVATGGALVPITVGLGAGAEKKMPRLSVTYTTDESKTPRPVSLENVLPAWAPEARQPVVTTPAEPELTKGGDWAAGKALFYGEAKCGSCHTVRGEGGKVGPDLSNLVHLNPESVLADIVDPSAKINPDHINYIVTTAAGETVSGLVRQEGEKVFVTEGPEKVTVLEKGEVKEIRPSKISLMPEGYKGLGEEKLRDILTFLTLERK